MYLALTSPCTILGSGTVGNGPQGIHRSGRLRRPPPPPPPPPPPLRTAATRTRAPLRSPGRRAPPTEPTRRSGWRCEALRTSLPAAFGVSAAPSPGDRPPPPPEDVPPGNTAIPIWSSVHPAWIPMDTVGFVYQARLQVVARVRHLSSWRGPVALVAAQRSSVQAHACAVLCRTVAAGRGGAKYKPLYMGPVSADMEWRAGRRSSELGPLREGLP